MMTLGRMLINSISVECLYMYIIKHFLSISVHPLINVYEELIITRLGSTVTLQCTIEASPKAVHFWVKKGTEPGHEGDYLQ